jgi:cytidine deaminase
MIKKEIKTTVFEYDSVSELSEIDRALIEKSKESAKNSYSPYSFFHVGTAVLLNNNEIITGNNQENAAYPSGLCAERVAVFYANSIYPDIPVNTIAIYGYSENENIDIPVSPCGACRQVLLETENRFNNSIKLIMSSDKKIVIINSIAELLPISFNKNLFVK